MQDIVKDSYTLMLGDCLERMREIPDGSVDMVLADLPYGTTGCKWDVVIPFEPLWEHYWRVLKSNGAIILFGSQPFTSVMNVQQIDRFRYEIIWEKTLGTNFMNARKMPIKKHETLSVFYRSLPTYNPQKLVGKPYRDVRNETERFANEVHGSVAPKLNYDNPGERMPISVIKFANPNQKKLHPTQKPVPLLEYLIRTYTNPGELVLDNTMGSGSTGVAAIQTGRRFVGVEKESAYFQIAAERLSLAQAGDTTSDTQQAQSDPGDSAPSARA